LGQDEHKFNQEKFINSQSTQTIQKASANAYISIRFGDIAGEFGGTDEAFGLNRFSNAQIGLVCGICDNLSAGLTFNHGNQLKYILASFLKFRIVDQKASSPISISAYGSLGITTMDSSSNLRDLNSFQNLAQRITYHGSVIFQRDIGTFFSISASLGYLHRNYVFFVDENGNFNLGLAARVAINEKLGICLEYNKLFSDYRNDNQDFADHLALAFELNSANHRIQISLSNSIGLTDGEFISYTMRSWTDGAFRLGFNLTGICN
jgi:hypothetical protein